MVTMSERGQAARQDEAHARFLNQYSTDATEVASIFTELSSHLEQQQEVHMFRISPALMSFFLSSLSHFSPFLRSLWTRLKTTRSKP